MKLLPKMSTEFKQTALGGAIAGAVLGVESGVSWFVAGYPQILKDKLAPIVPRNGALVADLAPAGYGLMVKRKRSSGKKANMANGILFYDLPKLLDLFAYNIGYQLGTPAPTAAVRLGNNIPMRIRPVMVNGIASSSFARQTSAGKYMLKNSNSGARASAGIGKYR